jgi:Flp pilus assembly protein protease CpaA
LLIRTAVKFLTDTGKISSDLRSGDFKFLTVLLSTLYLKRLFGEFILLSDVLGASALVDILNNAKPSNATEATVLGPFFTEDAHDSMSMPTTTSLTTTSDLLSAL